MNISSTGSTTSKTSSLGNTSLSGFGGLVSGLDRDSLIDALTSDTQTKITKNKQTQTKLEWKQEAYQAITDKVIDLEDNYLSYTSTSSLKSAATYAKSVLTAQGSADSVRCVSAQGSSDMTPYISINGVRQLASSASVLSDQKGTATAVTTKSLLDSDGNLSNAVTSNLLGKTIVFGQYKPSATDGDSFSETATFRLPASYTDDNGKTVQIDYTTDDRQTLVNQLNAAFRKADISLGENGSFSFTYDKDADKISFSLTGSCTIGKSSTALAGFGVDTSKITDSDSYSYSTRGLSADQLNGFTTKNFSTSSVSQDTSLASALSGKTVSVTYGGENGTVTLLTQEQKDAIEEGTYSSGEDRLNAIAKAMNKNFDTKFGSGKITVGVLNGALSFNSTDGKTLLSLGVSDTGLQENLGLSAAASNKLNTSLDLWTNRDKLGLSGYATKEDLNRALSTFSINGTRVSGLTADTTVDQMISKINGTSETGVKAAYLSGSNQFALIATNTGSGRSIDLGDSDSAANRIFGYTENTDSQDTSTVHGGFTEGRDAILTYSFGGSVSQTVTSSTNTFNISGITVTASGVFGYQKDSSGNLTDIPDSSESVTFTASADVDSVTDKVKSFIKAYNEIVTAVHDQITTKPDRGYDPLTDDQKDEMSDKEIEEWNKKAKEGILYSESTIRDFSSTLEGFVARALGNGIRYQDMEKIGITMSDDVYDGGTLKFDENKFREAMKNDSETVSKVLAGDDSTTGLVKSMENMLTPYATRFASRNGNSYGRLVEEAGSSKLTLSKENNRIYTTLKENKTKLETLKALLKTQQDRYISQFTTLEETISELNTQSAYITGLSG